MYSLFFKRLLDVILSILIFPFFIVLYLIIGLLIYIEDKGPVFYKASRLGQNKNNFEMYKFRSMKIKAPDLRNADGSTYNSENDPRVTKVGKFLRETSIDEVPQIINVIKGDMSLIGPRPDLPEHLEMYEGNESRKLEVKPGITGYSQAYFRNSIPWKERIKNDIYYVDHLSLWLDSKIFFKTIVSVFKKEDVFVE